MNGEALKLALKLALEALEWNMDYLPSRGHGTSMAREAIAAANEALSAPPQDDEERDPCPGCQVATVCRTPACGRLKLPLDHPYRSTQAGAAPLQPVQNRNALMLDRPMTFGGCPFCGRQSCVAGQCRSTTTPAQPEPTVPQWRNAAIAAYPNSDPDQWPDSFKVRFMEQEIAQLRATPPPQRGWIGLTEKDYIEVTVQHFGKNGVRWFEDSLPNFVKSVESKLREKNT